MHKRHRHEFGRAREQRSLEMSPLSRTGLSIEGLGDGDGGVHTRGEVDQADTDPPVGARGP